MSTARHPEWLAPRCAAERLPPDYASAFVRVGAPQADRIRSLAATKDRPVVIGINGAPGAGKSTLARFLAEWLRRECGLSCAVLALDDLYLGHAARAALAREKHPLLATRGVPGTHDAALGCRLLRSLIANGPQRTVTIPVFDKASDDRMEKGRWRKIDAPVDVVLFEGWCIAARPQAAAELERPVNALEAEEDANGAWRRWVNARLASDYARLFEWLDALIMLRVPSFGQVHAWRALQESRLAASRRAGGAGDEPARTMDSQQLRRFVMHYERLTRHMLDTLPDHADTVIRIDSAHRMVGTIMAGWDGRLRQRLGLAARGG